jgi:hypothetical protein
VADSSWRVWCTRCGERIGIYEPLWSEFPDGTLHPSSYLNLSHEQRRGDSRLWHLGCLAPDAVPPAIETIGPGRVGGSLRAPGASGSMPDGEDPQPKPPAD